MNIAIFSESYLLSGLKLYHSCFWSSLEFLAIRVAEKRSMFFCSWLCMRVGISPLQTLHIVSFLSGFYTLTVIGCGVLWSYPPGSSMPLFLGCPLRNFFDIISLNKIYKPLDFILALSTHRFFFWLSFLSVFQIFESFGYVH